MHSSRRQNRERWTRLSSTTREHKRQLSGNQKVHKGLIPNNPGIRASKQRKDTLEGVAENMRVIGISAVRVARHGERKYELISWSVVDETRSRRVINDDCRFLHNPTELRGGGNRHRLLDSYRHDNQQARAEFVNQQLTQ